MIVEALDALAHALGRRRSTLTHELVSIDPAHHVATFRLPELTPLRVLDVTIGSSPIAVPIVTMRCEGCGWIAGDVTSQDGLDRLNASAHTCPPLHPQGSPHPVHIAPDHPLYDRIADMLREWEG